MWLTDLIILVAGLGALIVGAELLVRGASRLAMDVGLTQLVIEVTVVAFGTSAPELTVSVVSAAEGETGITLGNIIGGNVFNVLIMNTAALTVAFEECGAGIDRNRIALVLCPGRWLAKPLASAWQWGETLSVFIGFTTAR